MEFRVLGPVGIAAGGRTIPLVSERQRTLLAALLSQAGQPVSSETLADAVWDGRPPVSAATSLRSHIARLRKVLGAAGGGQALMTDLGGYHIDLGGHRLDAQRFEELLADQPDDPRSALDTLEEALGLWYGAAYAPFTDRSFARAEAARLTGLREAALADRTDLLLELGRHAEAVGELEARISSQPLDERAHTQLMLALYRAGRPRRRLGRVPIAPGSPRRGARDQRLGVRRGAVPGHPRPGAHPRSAQGDLTRFARFVRRVDPRAHGGAGTGAVRPDDRPRRPR